MQSGVKHRLRLLSRVRNRLARIRHFRGHGVHSPYIYSIVRNVFMSHKLAVGDHSLYRELHEMKIIGDRSAIELQNIFTHCGYKRFEIDGRSSKSVDFKICTLNSSNADIKDAVDRASDSGTTVVIISPYATKERERCCKTIVVEHPSTSLFRNQYLLLFNNHLPKQLFRL